jgi:hypothetical protein
MRLVPELVCRWTSPAPLAPEVATLMPQMAALITAAAMMTMTIHTNTERPPRRAA